MRYQTNHKDQTRERIVDAAGLLFKEHGIDATGIATIMKHADLTNGAFYAHFESKESLIEAVIADQVQKQIEMYQNSPKDLAGIQAIVDIYLSLEHRDNCGMGCPSAALLDEIGRRSSSTKKAYSKGMMRLIDSFQDHFPNSNPEQSRALITALIGLLVGTLQLARAMDDSKTSEFVLESGRKAARALLETA